jgi:hypothetical protein
LDDLLRLDCLVARAALCVQELEQFLKCFCVRGVVQECALPLYVHEVFRLKLVEMVREGRVWNVQCFLNLTDDDTIWMGEIRVT